ncbi:hypothetical protein SEUCBS140593_010295 [Sporothrix eucalyptigena]|uniref:Uncharacterized protein n=1 Tax=Sporothrix eucalyptigena TaxID=1812306 RepID=A0ABP0D3R1_9PEZI
MASRMLGAAGGRRDSSRTEESGRLNKRRKLDSEKTDTPPYTAFHYGRYGQVEPGALTMEIVSCDGGLYSDGSSYAAENILKNDNSVYCTKGNRCNIVLQHQGCTTFSLKELIIKAPGKNYSSPVKEGMVFLSMSKDELVQAEQYQSNAINAFRRSPLFEYLEANQWRHRPRDARDDEDDEAQARNSGRAIRIARDVIVHEMMDNPTEVPFVTAPNQPAFHVLTECSEDEDDETPGRLGRDRDGRGPGWRSSTTGWSPTPLRNRPRRRLPVYDESTPLGAHLSWEVDHYRDSEDEDDDNFTELYDLGNATISSPDSPPNDGEGVHVPARPRADRERRDRDSAHNRGGDQTTGGEASSTSFRSAAYFENRSQGLSALRTESPPTSLPRAEFHIEPHKNKCTIVFDPPVTARYILLKMWNPRQDMGGNIDIQGVVAKGFAGPRYFPAMELR